jgi:folate/biopterin transporter
MPPQLRRKRIDLCLEASAFAVFGGASCVAVSAFCTPSVPVRVPGGASLLASPAAASSSASPRHYCSSTKLFASTEEDLNSPATLLQEEKNDDSTPAAFLRDKLFLGIEPTPEIIAIMTIYFVEGALGLARLAQTFLLKDTLHLGPAEMAALTGLFTLPWTVKPIYGFISDGFPLFGYRRRSYLVVAGLVGCLSYTALGADFWNMLEPYAASSAAVADATVAAGVSSAGWLGRHVSHLQGTIAALILSSACIAFSDVVADGIVVQRTRESDDPKVAGGLQSLCWGSAALGGLISAYFSGSLLEIMGPREVFQITAVLPLLVATIALFVDEKPVWEQSKLHDASALHGVEGVKPVQADGIQEQVSALWSAIKQPAIWRPALFIFLWQSTPTGDSAMLYFMTNDLGFGPEFLGRARLISAASTLVGVWGYQKFLRSVPIKDILFWTTVASAPLGMIQLLLITHANRDIGIPDGAFILGDDVVLSILGEFAFLPTLVLAARLCPPGVEAVLFATLMSIFNGASTVGTEVGAALTKYLSITESNFDNLALLNVICSLSCLYPLVFIGWLDDVGGKSEEEQGEASEIVLDVPSGAVDTAKGER